MMDTPARLLLIEDDFALSDGLSRALRRAGHEVEAAGSGLEACRRLDERPFELVVLDLGLPDLDGSEVVRHLARTGAGTPVLVLSARDGLDERVRLLDLGADDYLVKPAAMDEFLARVRAALRRRRGGGASRVPLGRLSLDMEGRRAFLDGRPMDFNAREWALLAFLAGRPDRVISREDIADALGGADERLSMNAVEQIVSRFRKRIAAAGLGLHTVRGLGYYLETGHGE